jgi:hypothetical protein
VQPDIDALIVAILVATILLLCWRVILWLIVAGVLMLMIFGFLSLLELLELLRW